MKSATSTEGNKQKPQGVKRVHRAPLNPLRWCVELVCGHEVWVTSRAKPTRKLYLCERCEK